MRVNIINGYVIIHKVEDQLHVLKINCEDKHLRVLSSLIMD